LSCPDPIPYVFVFSAEFDKQRNPGARSSSIGREKPISLDAGMNLANRDTSVNLVDQNLGGRGRNFASPKGQQRGGFDLNPVLSQHSGVKAFTPGKPSTQDKFYQSGNEFGEKKPDLARHTEILELNEKVLEKEEIVIKREGEINLYKNEVESLRDECGRAKSKLHAVELYASELQRKNDLLTQEIGERNTIIQELQSADLGLKTQLNINEVKSLRQILISKDEELGSLKRQLKAVLHSQADPGTNTNHYEGFLEQQAKELASTKKQLQEFESRSEECKRRWNQLIKENIGKEEKIKGLTFQLNRQIENYQTLYADTDRKVANLNSKFISLVSEEREASERQAAEFLVQQMVEIQEERERIANENEQLHLQIQELIGESKRLNEEMQDLQQWFNGERASMIDDRGAGVNVGKMKMRIDELEDLLHEIKQNEGVRRVTELNDTIAELERKLAFQEKSNLDLKDKLSDVKANAGTIHEQSAIDFFTKLLEEKDQLITHLKTQNDVLLSKEKQYQIEIEHLKDNLQQSSLQFENYKQRQSRLENALSHKNPTQQYAALSAEHRIQDSMGGTGVSYGGGVPNIRFSYE